MIDIHSHLLPGIDDGPKTWAQSLELCRAIVDDGIRLSVATPHLIDGVYENTRSVVEPLTTELNQRLGDAGVALRVLPGAEVDFSSRFATDGGAELPSLAGAGAVLLEMPMTVVPPAILETIFAIRSRGGIAVIAHPERNEVLQDNFRIAHSWVEAGALLQLDGDSLLGLWGNHTQRCGEELLCAGLAHAIASDAHSTAKRPPRLTRALERAVTLIGDSALKLTGDGPRAIVGGLSPDARLTEPATQQIQATRTRVARGKRQRGLLGRLFTSIGR